MGWYCNSDPALVHVYFNFLYCDPIKPVCSGPWRQRPIDSVHQSFPVRFVTLHRTETNSTCRILLRITCNFSPLFTLFSIYFNVKVSFETLLRFIKRLKSELNLQEIIWKEIIIKFFYLNLWVKFWNVIKIFPLFLGTFK